MRLAHTSYSANTPRSVREEAFIAFGVPTGRAEVAGRTSSAEDLLGSLPHSSLSEISRFRAGPARFILNPNRGMGDARAHGVRSAHLFMQPHLSSLQEATLADDGKQGSLAETVLLLAEARRAQEVSQSGHARGKIVLSVL
jgi:hypothetical protein